MNHYIAGKALFALKIIFFSDVKMADIMFDRKAS